MDDENEKDNKELINLLQEKVDYFYKEKVVVHIKLKSGFWKRGVIINKRPASFFILNENLEGSQPIFYLEIKDIEKYIEKKGDYDEKKQSSFYQL